MEEFVSRLHHLILRPLIDNGVCPANEEIRHHLGVGSEVFQATMHRLADIHGVVLHPGTTRPWVIHPFSLVPTSTYVKGSDHGWWAPCLWCGFGVSTLVGGQTEIHSRIAGETEPVVIPVTDGRPSPSGLLVHFAVRPRDAWNNVHEHCAMVQPFRSEADARRWSTRHGLPFGEMVTLEQTAELGRIWYGHHADPDWHKWTMQEAQNIFHEVGLRSDFWNLGDLHGRF